jgi:two-component system response regulator HydG
MSQILIVEDDKVARELLDEILRREGHGVEALPSGDEAIARAGKRDYDLVISDVRLGDSASGFDVLAAFQQRAAETPVILITAFGDVTGAMAAIQKGAYDYVSKPFNVGELTLTVSRALERTRLIEENRAQRAREGDKPPHIESIVGAAPAMLDVYKMVARVAPTMSTVLVVGESGTGKELVARAIHTHSPRANGPFVAVNCTALTESLLESELFGHAKGAFTGAVASKRGIFEEAQGGTVFLDEIGDVAGKMQAQLLRVLQEGEVRRVGGTEAIQVDVRVVAATNRELEEEVKQGRFREDLYFRINVVTIRLPPLRERPSDIPLLVDHFLAIYCRKNGKPAMTVTRAALDRLTAYAWPGNVRELENVIERAVVLGRSATIDVENLPAPIAQAEARGGSLSFALGTPLEEIEQRVIRATLDHTGGDKRVAAQLLGIATRTIYRKLAAEGEEDELGRGVQPE